MKIENLKKLILVLTLTLMVVGFSGCVKKEVESVVENNGNYKQVELVENANKLELDDKKENFVVEELENGWKKFTSNSCGFEISFPDDFEWSQHCEETKLPFTILLGIGSWLSVPYGGDGDIGISIKKYDDNPYADDKERAIEDIEKLKKTKKEGYSGKLGKTITTYESIELSDKVEIIRNKEYLKPIEGPPGVFKDLSLNYKGDYYVIGGQIPFNNSKMNNLFHEIVKTFKILE